MAFFIALGVCAILYFIGLEALGFWGFIIFCLLWSSDIDTRERGTKKVSSRREKRVSETKIYEDGTRRISNISETGYYYSDGKESWIGILGEENRSNGEVVRENAYIPERRDIYNAQGQYIGYEYEDALGITCRVDERK